MFLIISKGRMKINAGVNAKNRLTKVYVIKDLLGIRVIANVYAINHVILGSIYTNKTVSVEKG